MIAKYFVDTGAFYAFKDPSDKYHLEASSFMEVAEVIHVSVELEEKAWQIFVKYSDKDYSFTDCTSFAIMEEEGIKRAFAFDGHFSQHGFIMLP